MLLARVRPHVPLESPLRDLGEAVVAEGVAVGGGHVLRGAAPVGRDDWQPHRHRLRVRPPPALPPGRQHESVHGLVELRERHCGHVAVDQVHFRPLLLGPLAPPLRLAQLLRDLPHLALKGAARVVRVGEEVQRDPLRRGELPQVRSEQDLPPLARLPLEHAQEAEGGGVGGRARLLPAEDQLPNGKLQGGGDGWVKELHFHRLGHLEDFGRLDSALNEGGPVELSGHPHLVHLVAALHVHRAQPVGLERGAANHEPRLLEGGGARRACGGGVERRRPRPRLTMADNDGGGALFVMLRGVEAGKFVQPTLRFLVQAVKVIP
mmetsp:Transcript_27542/g.60155  ORF Transcript_27542/g.60155 Transcript_27542/m.60155 type:complete len:321 (+) Transcript_27542:365-1327(+)